MRVDLLDFELPADRIAQTPAEERDGARLLVVDPRDALEVGLTDAWVAELADLLPRGALVVVNDTRVILARLIARKPETGGKVEIFLVRPETPEEIQRYKQASAAPETPGVEPAPEADLEVVWRALGKASKHLRFDQDLEVGADLRIRLLGRATDDGLLRVRLSTPRPLDEVLDEHGHVPLPPYIKRAIEPSDRLRYQTVFARHPGAVAAPTAGLHLSNALLGRLAIAGIDLASVTLHIGLGTFQPVHTVDLSDHRMHEEAFEVGLLASRAVVEAKRAGRPVVAVGTTVVRTLEAAARVAILQGSADPVVPCRGTTRLLLQPGDRLHVVDALLTNFHLPRSTLLAVVATFIGLDHLRSAYAHAIEHAYRFYSYGDAMLIRAVLPPEVVSASVENPRVPPPRIESIRDPEGAAANPNEAPPRLEPG